MNIAEVFSEAWRNITSGASRAVWFALALAIPASGLGLADIIATQSLISAANSYKESGADVITLVAAGAIDGEKCERLSELPGVAAAGALRAAPDTPLLALPGSPVPTKEITNGLPSVLGAQVHGEGGMVVSDELGKELNVGPLAVDRNQGIATAHGTAKVDGTYDYPADGRRAGFAYGLLSPVPAGGGAFDECWVRSWPPSPEMRMLIRLSLIPGAGEPNADPPVVSQLNTRKGTEFDGAARFEQRVTRFGAMAALAVGMVLGYFSVRSRRLELASAKHSGVTAGTQGLQIGIEHAVVALMAWILAMPMIIYAARSAGLPDLPVMVVLGTKPVLVAAPAFIIGAIAGAATIREKQLFRYFSNR